MPLADLPWPKRSMATQERSFFESAVVRRCQEACRRIDATSRVVSMTEDAAGLTHLRFRAGDTHTLEQLRAALGNAMRLSTTRVTESWVDGTLEADVTVLTARQERRAARHEVAKGRLVAYWLLLAWVFLFLGIGEWSASVRAVRGKDEL